MTMEVGPSEPLAQTRAVDTAAGYIHRASFSLSSFARNAAIFRMSAFGSLFYQVLR